MTREEAIEAIKEAYGNSEYTDEIIKALEQEPTTKIGEEVGMSIDDAIRYFEDMKKACCCGNEQATIAIDTMRKYQKIEQIYKEWFSDKDRTGADAYVRIGEVLKDGTD